MDVRFWGTRGSIPTPLTPQQVRAKIEAAVQRITPRDLESPDSRERFVASLPPFLFGTVGGNTSLGCRYRNKRICQARSTSPR